MNIFNYYLEEVQPKFFVEDKFFAESGLQNINKLSQAFNKAVIYFHEDL